MNDAVDRPEPRRGKPGRLRQKLMQLSLTLTGIGVALLAVSLIAMAWLRTNSNHLALERTPAVVATQRCQIGLQRSLAGLRGWVALGDQRFRTHRRAAWTEQIEPALRDLRGLRETWPNPADRERVDVLTRLLVELKESQWWVEDVAHTEGNQPALHTLRQRVEPISRTIAKTIDTLVDSAGADVLGLLVRFRRAFTSADDGLARFVADGDTLRERAFVEDLDAAERALVGLAESSFAPDHAERVAFLVRELLPFSRFAGEAVAARRGEEWNVALYRMRKETVALTQEVTGLLDRLAASQNAMMQDDVQAIKFAGVASMVLSSVLILLMAAIAYALASHRASQITEPITRLSAATDDLAAGTLNEDLVVTTDDELATLTDSFNRMRARLQEAESALKQSNLKLQGANTDLERHNQFIRDTFGRYLSDDVVTSVLETPGGLQLGGASRRVTILMSDLRGFTSLSARLDPEQVVAILNRYLGAMVEVITRYEGTVDEFIGDAILVIFGAPIWHEDHATRAIACAAAMQLAMDAVNEANRGDGLPEIEMGIGVNTGEVVVGNIGSDIRMKYGVVGSVVNLTSRIESYTVGGQILTSEATRREVGEILRVGARFEIDAKGVDETTRVHDVRGIGGSFDLLLPNFEDALVDLLEAIPLRFTIVEGKHLGGDWLHGRLVRLSARAGEVACEETVAPRSNLKIELAVETEAQIPNELYAKTTESGPQGFLIHMTSVPPELATWLEGRRVASTPSENEGTTG